MMIRCRDEGGDFAGICGDRSFEGGNIVPWNTDYIFVVVFEYAMMAGGLHPGGGAVITAGDSDDFLSTGRRARGHDRVIRHVRTILCEEGPIRYRDQVHEKFRQFDHARGGRAGGIRQGHLLRISGIHHSIHVTQDHGTVCAHIINEIVAVNVPEMRTFGLRGKEGVMCDGHAGRRAEVAVYPAWDYFRRTGEQGRGLAVFILLHD